MWPNAVWAGSVSALRWVPLSVYAADGKLAAYSKGHEVHWDWGILYGEDVGILYGPGIAGVAFRLLYRKSG
jgi:hypothetical protein